MAALSKLSTAHEEQEARLLEYEETATQRLEETTASLREQELGTSEALAASTEVERQGELSLAASEADAAAAREEAARQLERSTAFAEALTAENDAAQTALATMQYELRANAEDMTDAQL